MFRKGVFWTGVLLIALMVTTSVLTTMDAIATTAAVSPTIPSTSEPITREALGTSTAASDLSADEVADLLHMREEEKLARDVYLALYDKWGSRVFQNIARAEQVHMDAVGALLQTYGIEDPVAKTGDARGVFVNPDLQALYEQLVSQGSTSLVDALTVGVTIEKLDIEDLNRAIARTTHDDIRQVYKNLRRGSENHLQAFLRNLRALGVNYQPWKMLLPALFSGNLN